MPEEPLIQRSWLPPDKAAKAVKARGIQEWMDIFIECIAEGCQTGFTITGSDDPNEPQAEIFKNEEILKGVTYERFRGELIPNLRRIARDFELAGLDIGEDLEVSGCEFLTPAEMKQRNVATNVAWRDPHNPVITFHWPDGDFLVFKGIQALHAVAFFQFWQSCYTPVTGARGEGDVRIIEPGTPEAKEYEKAKKRDQANGLEPQ